MTNSVGSPETMADELDLTDTVPWRGLLAETVAILRSSGITQNPDVEARWIVEEATGTTGSEFMDVLGTLSTVRSVGHLDSMVARRLTGEPIQYVLGHWAFRSLDLMVDNRVLIPRPETEVVAGLAIAELDRQHPDGGGTAVDLGTGSGALGLSLAAERPSSQVLLTDLSSDALVVARSNLAGLGVRGRNVEIAEGSWFDAIPDRYLGQFDVVVSNPPYVRTGDLLPVSVDAWEPKSALLAGPDGLDDLRRIAGEAIRWLRPSGALVLEMDASQTAVVASMAHDEGFHEVTIHRDLAGLERAVVGRLAGLNS
jgi:release factor glutamine methyltransferase